MTTTTSFMHDAELLLDPRRLNNKLSAHITSYVSALAATGMFHVMVGNPHPVNSSEKKKAVEYIIANTECDGEGAMCLPALRKPYDTALALGVMHCLGDKVKVDGSTFGRDAFLSAEVFTSNGFNKDEALSIYLEKDRDELYSRWVEKGYIPDIDLTMRLLLLSLRIQDELNKPNDAESVLRNMMLRVHGVDIKSDLRSLGPISNHDDAWMLKRVLSARALTEAMGGPLQNVYKLFTMLTTIPAQELSRSTEKKKICGYEGYVGSCFGFVICALSTADAISKMTLEKQTQYRNDMYAAVGWMLYRLYDHSLVTPVA